MNASTLNPAREFPQTSWTLLADARARLGSAPEEFARRYYRPVYAYLAAITGDRDSAEDLTQSFFADVFVSGRLLARVDKSKGSFRPFLKQCLRNYVITKARERLRKKRWPPEREIRPDQQSDGWDQLGFSPDTSPDMAFHTEWVRALLQQALSRVEKLCEQKGQTNHFALFLGRYLSEASRPPSWKDLGTQYGVDEKAARSRAETVARHFRVVLRQILVEELGSSELADEEIANLLVLF